MEIIIYERDDLVSWREKYLREIAKVPETEPQREIVYMDETWLRGPQVNGNIVEYVCHRSFKKKQPEKLPK